VQRLGFAAAFVVFLAKEYPVRFGLWITSFDALAAVVAYWLTSEIHEDRALIVGLAIVGGILAALALLFLWGLLTAPRRRLEIRMANIETTLAQIEGQVLQLTEEKFGEPLQFLPVYQELRSVIRENLRKCRHAQETGALWSRSDCPEYRQWNKHKSSIATNPYAQLDGVHGDLVEAFDHAERLVSGTTLRFGSRRRVKASDDLGDAIESHEKADLALTRSIDRLEPLQAIAKYAAEEP
jgi:hypothetical protein